MKRQVFYSFHFDNDVMRVQQIRNIGVIEGNKPVAPNDWEQIKRSEYAVKKWIDDNMKYKSCVVVLVGSETASRKWIDYEIRKAWNEGKGLFGIYIHNLKDPRTETCRKGANPFDNVLLKNGQKLSFLVPCYDPNSWDTYNDIAKNLENWVDFAIKSRGWFNLVDWGSCYCISCSTILEIAWLRVILALRRWQLSLANYRRLCDRAYHR